MVEEELATIGMLRPWLAMFVQPCRDVADIYTAGLHMACRGKGRDSKSIDCRIT